MHIIRTIQFLGAFAELRNAAVTYSYLSNAQLLSVLKLIVRWVLVSVILVVFTVSCLKSESFQARSQNFEKRVLASSCLSVLLPDRMEYVASTGRIFMNYDI